MEEVNKNIELNDTDKKLHISDVSESFSEWNEIWGKFGLENYISGSSEYQLGLMDLRNWLEKNFEVPLKRNSH